jgi:hypothetical protein
MMQLLLSGRTRLTATLKLTDFLLRLLNIIAVQQNLELRREAARLRTMAAEQSGKHEESAEHMYGPQRKFCISKHEHHSRP